MRLFIEQIQPLSNNDIPINDTIITYVNPEVEKYIKKRLLSHNSKLSLNNKDKKFYEKIIINLIKYKKKNKYINITRKELKAIKLLIKGDIFIELKYSSDISLLI